MGFRQGAYARIWSVNDEGKYSTANITISKKPKDSDAYVVDFSDRFVRLIGEAHERAKGLGLPTREQFNAVKEQFDASGGKGKVDTPNELKGASVQITSCDVTSNYDVKTRQVYTNFAIFGFDIPENDSNRNSNASSGNRAANTRRSAAAPAKPASKPSVMVEVDDDELPF